MLVALLALAACARPPVAQGPTPVPDAPAVRMLPGRGVQIDGHGTTQTEDMVPDYAGGLPIGIDKVTLSHDGRSSFIVTAVQGDQAKNLTTAIGAYRGQRPLVVEGSVSFQVTADGAWSLLLQPIPTGGEPAFSSSGDAVSAYFTPPGGATWSINYDGQTAFFVYAHCLGGSVVVEDAFGAVNEAKQLEFRRGPCFWEVCAESAWSLQPGP